MTEMRTWGTYDNSRVWAVFTDPLTCQSPKISRISRDQRATFTRAVVELFSVGRADHPHLVGTLDVHPAFTKDARDDRREVLVEIDLHAAPVSASALSAMSSLISSGQAR